MIARRLAAWLILALVLIGCSSGAEHRADAGPDAGGATPCQNALFYRHSCGLNLDPAGCAFPSRELDCEGSCDLAVSCDYFQGKSPAEARKRAQCGSRCTCESAQRRATECGIDVSFSCDDVCNCPYASDCSTGIPAYAKCRQECPPWPEQSDGSDGEKQ